MNSDGSGLMTLTYVARALGMSIENLRALEKRGRLPEGCEPQIDLITGTRGWTADQVKKLKDWNDDRVGKMEREELSTEGTERTETPE